MTQLINDSQEIKEVFDLFTAFKLGDFSKRLNSSKNYGIPELFVTELNSLAHVLEAQQAKDKIEKINQNTNLDLMNSLEKTKYLQEALQNMVDNVPVGIVTLDSNYRFLEFNSTFEKMLGYSKEELKKLSILDITHPEDINISKYSADKALYGKDKSTISHEKRYITKSGDIIWVRISAKQKNNTINNEKIQLSGIIEDITQRKIFSDIMEAKSREAQKLIDGIPALISHWDVNYRNLAANNKYYTQFNKTPEQMRGLHVKEVIGDIFEQVKPYMDKALLGEKATTVSEFMNEDGLKSYAQVTFSPDFHNESVVGFFTIAIDITEQKIAEYELKKINTVFETVLENIPIAIFLKDVQDSFRISLWNKAAENIFEIPKDAIIGKTTHELWPRELADMYHAADMKVCETNVTIDIPTEKSISKSRGEIWMHTRKVPLHLDNNINARYLLEICDDITEKHKKNEENSFVLEALKIGIWKYNPVTQELWWDKSMYDLYEMNENEFTGHYQAWESTLTFESKQQAVEELNKAIRGEKEFNTFFQIKSHSGEKKFISGRAKVIRNADGTPIMMYGVNQDITREKKLERELNDERAKSLHSAKLASLGEMSAGIAHEINNPLTIIASNAELLEKFKNDPQKYSSKINSIQRSCERISKIVLGLKKFARLSDESNKDSFILADIVRGSIQLTESKSKRHSTYVEAIIKTNSKILCDEVEIEQVIINLINNAIDAVKSLSERWVKIFLLENEKDIILQVKDSGQGISPQIEQKMFQPFFTTKPVGQGTGLGLSIIKGILDDHKATISLNRDDIHTCFEIIFSKLSEV